MTTQQILFPNIILSIMKCNSLIIMKYSCQKWSFIIDMTRVFYFNIVVNALNIEGSGWGWPWTVLKYKIVKKPLFPRPLPLLPSNVKYSCRPEDLFLLIDPKYSVTFFVLFNIFWVISSIKKSHKKLSKFMKSLIII